MRIRCAKSVTNAKMARASRSRPIFESQGSIITLAAGHGWAVAFRLADANDFLLVETYQNKLYLYKRQGGVERADESGAAGTASGPYLLKYN